MVGHDGHRGAMYYVSVAPSEQRGAATAARWSRPPKHGCSKRGIWKSKPAPCAPENHRRPGLLRRPRLRAGRNRAKDRQNGSTPPSAATARRAADSGQPGQRAPRVVVSRSTHGSICSRGRGLRRAQDRARSAVAWVATIRDGTTSVRRPSGLLVRALRAHRLAQRRSCPRASSTAAPAPSRTASA